MASAAAHKQPAGGSSFLRRAKADALAQDARAAHSAGNYRTAYEL